MPGTFTQPVQSSAVLAGPLLTPPVVSLGSGLTPPTVINGQTTFLSAPLSNLASSSAFQQRTYAGYVTPTNGYVPMPTPMALPIGSLGEKTNDSQAAQASKPVQFDFVVAPKSSGISGGLKDTGVGDTNLGELAATLRKGPPPTQRTFTNDDIARLNGVINNNFQMPAASTQQPSYPRQQPAEQPQPHSSIGSAPTTPGTKPSPFSPKPYAQETPTAAARGAATETAENVPPTIPDGADNTTATNADVSHRQQAQEPQSSAVSSGRHQLPATSSFLPLVALCGVGITALGFLFAGRHS
jgi:hypothetical protein